MMRRKLALIAVLAVASFGPQAARAHECEYTGAGMEQGEVEECRDTRVMPNWRDGNYVPLFDLEDRDDEQQRKDAQRWREECAKYDAEGNYSSSQQCIWFQSGFSGFPDRDGSGTAPNEAHAGVGASHCFLFEFAHQCEDHDVRRGEGVHDAHGGSIYADLCLAANDESKYCDDGTTDTQAGVTIMDHNPCGTIVPIVACTDEYHVVRPLDQAYTQEQMADSQSYVARIAADPNLYLCGYEQYRSGNPICPGGDSGGDHGGHSHLPAVTIPEDVPNGPALPGTSRRGSVRAPVTDGARAGLDAPWVAAGGAHPLGSAQRGNGGADGLSWLMLALAGVMVAVRARRLRYSGS